MVTTPTGTPVQYGVEAGVATITLDSPHNRNALSAGLVERLLGALGQATANPAVRVIVLTHTGTVFCSGADLTETAAAFDSGRMPGGRLTEVLAVMCECPKPIVARIAGPARAGGLGLIAAADLAVCTQAATFAFTEVRIGVIPAVISATVLRRLAPRAAVELYLTGSVFDGDRAAAVGLVTRAVPAPDLDAAVAGYVSALLRAAPGALAGAKMLLRGRFTPADGAETLLLRSLGEPEQDGGPTDQLRAQLAVLSAVSGWYFRSAEAAEGIAAFREHRDPSWVPSG